MISIFTIYSPDRKPQLKNTLACLKDMDLYEHCQKTLVVDGKSNVWPNDWMVIEVPRKGKYHSWKEMWDIGVSTASNDTVLYLESDRVLPTDYLLTILENIKDNKILYSECLDDFLSIVQNTSQRLIL